MSDLIPWGYGGVQLAQEYQMNQQLMASRALDMQGKQQTLDANQQEADINAQASHLMQSIANGQPVPGVGGNSSDSVETPAQAFDLVGQNLLKMGAPQKGLEYLKAAGTLRKSQADLQNVNTNAALNKAKLLQAQADVMGRQLGSATTPEEWDQGLQSLQEAADSGLFPQEVVDKYKQIPFSPQAATHIKNSALSVKDQASFDYQNQRIRQAEDNAKATAAYRDARLAQERTKIENAERAKAVNTKTGAAASAPTPAQLKEAESIISSTIFNNDPPTWDGKKGTESTSYRAYMAGVSDIAAQANAMLAENKGLSRREALNRAVLMSKANGDWDIETTDESFFKGFFGKDEVTTTKYSGMGNKPEEALPAPVKENKIDANGLTKGKWYTAPNGQTFRYDGDGKVTTIK